MTNILDRRSLMMGAAGAVAAGPLGLRPASGQTPAEPPLLAARVASGDLPPMAARLPATPRVIPLSRMGARPGAMAARSAC